MRRLLTFLILLIHVNTSMFIPVVDDVDVFDNSGQQVGDINTLVEYIDQVVLGHKPKSHPDSDDDQAHFFNMVKAHRFIVNHIVYAIAKPLAPKHEAPVYAAAPEEKPFSVAYDVTAPPPKFS